MTAKLPVEVKRTHNTERYLVWAKENRTKANANTKKWRQKNREHYLAQKRKWMLKGKYGITPAQFEDMAIAQEYKCAICEQLPNNKLHVDHDHKTGKIRGLLCARCNLGIGSFEDNTGLLLKAVKYLN